MKKYIEPHYGDLAPEVMPKSEMPSLKLFTPAFRKRVESEQFCDMCAAYRKTSVYDALCELEFAELSCEAKDGYRVPISVYYPKGERASRPVILFVHGGGFVFNNPTTYDYVTRYFAHKTGAVVFSVDYRLAPEHKYPTAQEDCYAALQWVNAHAGEHGGDPKNITLIGDSAGGNLVASVCLMARDRRGPRIATQVLIYPALQHGQPRTDSELRYGKGYHITLEATDSLVEVVFKNPADALEAYASPLLAPDVSNLPAAVFVSAECDVLLDQGLMYAKRLSDQGVPVSYRIYPGILHGFIGETYAKSFDAMDWIATFVK